MYYPISMTMVDTLQNLLNTMGSVSLWIKLSCYNVFKELASSNAVGVREIQIKNYTEAQHNNNAFRVITLY